jgi:uncharacterized protein (TIRG00374 family)
VTLMPGPPARAAAPAAGPTQPSARSRLRPWRTLLVVAGYPVVCVIAWLSLDHARFVEGLARLRVVDLLAVVAVGLAHVAARALRFHWLVRQAEPIAYRLSDSLRIFLAGLGLGMITPGRLGDLARVRFTMDHGVPWERGLGIVATERVLDLLAIMGSILLVGGLLAAPAEGAAARTAAAALMVMLTGGTLLVTMRRARDPILRGLAGLLARVRGEAAGSRAVERLRGIFTVWDQVFRSPPVCAGWLAYTLAAWVIEFLKLWLVLRLLGVQVSPLVPLFVYPVSLLGVAVHEGVVGVTEVALLCSLGRVDVALASVAVVVDRAISILLPLVLWGLSLPLRRRAPR